MKRIFNTNYNHQSLNFALLLLRVIISIFILSHGLVKLNTVLSGAEIKFSDPIGLGVKTSYYLAIFAEVICAILLFLGLATRLAVIPLIITMIVAVFFVHGADGFSKQEIGGLYLLVFVFLLFSGAGRFSIDSLFSKKSGRRR